ncbi:MAG: methyltransferase domain-containing protein [Pseudomonadota bacterium]
MLNFISLFTSPFRKIAQMLRHFPMNYHEQKAYFAEYMDSLRYKLHNLLQVNIDLGIYHINMGNFNDAILRFKLIDKFLSKGDPRVYYYLGWCYLFKGNVPKALKSFEQVPNMDNIGLITFLQNKDNAAVIPREFSKTYKELNIKAEQDRLEAESLNLPHLFVRELRDVVEELPKDCKVLDLGVSLGFIGSEMNKVLPKNYHLTGVESVGWMVDNALILKEKGVYDAVQNQTIQDFLIAKAEEYDIITSFCSLGFAKNLTECFAQIHRNLKPSGYFAVVLPMREATILNLGNCSFEYSRQDVEEQLKLAGFRIVRIKEWDSGKPRAYTMFILIK